jgi:cytoskeletal protein CcmA (bactofilin family)
MAKIYEQENSGGVNIIANGTFFVGNINTSGDCRIDGNVKGNIHSKGKIIIGESGSVEGDIVCNIIDIEGAVKANIHAAEQLSLRSTATLTGNVIVKKIAIEMGANFEGNCRMNTEPQPEQIIES